MSPIMNTFKWEKDVMLVLTKSLSLRPKWHVVMESKYLAEISTAWVIDLISSECSRVTSQLLDFISAQW